MSTSVWCEIVCDKCARSSPGQHCHGATVPRAALKKAATTNGWTFRGDDAFCDLCTKKECDE